MAEPLCFRSIQQLWRQKTSFWRQINRPDFEGLYLKPPMTKWAQSESCIEPGEVCWRVSLQSSDQ